MKKILSIVASIALGGLIMQSCTNNAKVALVNQADSINYSWGVYLGDEYLKDFATLPELNKKAYLAAFENGMKSDGTSTLNQDSALAVVSEFIQKVQMNQRSNQTADSASQTKLVPGQDYDIDKVSDALATYISLNIKEGFKELPCGFNSDLLSAGFVAAFSETGKTLISVDDAKAIVDEYQIKLQQEEMAKTESANQSFMEEYRAKEGVEATESGLLYRVITEGKGKKPVATDKVRVHYKGTLTNGSVFDSSIERGEPAEFLLNQVIPGWTEGVQLMSVGSKYEFAIPPELGYGSRNAGSIPPNSVLIFEVELLDIVK